MYLNHIQFRMNCSVMYCLGFPICVNLRCDMFPLPLLLVPGSYGAIVIVWLSSIISITYLLLVYFQGKLYVMCMVQTIGLCHNGFDMYMS
jgi:hypothetical protein